jgi:hypothetical protein
MPEGDASPERDGTSRRQRRSSSVASIAVLLILTAAAAIVYMRISASSGSSGSPASSASVTRSGQPPVAPAAQASGGPQALGSLEVNPRLQLKCTLPVTVYSRRARISLPSGLVTLDGAQALDARTPNASSYVLGRWLPVPQAWVSPDRKSYASVAAVPGSAEYQAVVLSDADTGNSRTLWQGKGQVSLIGWGPGGLYFVPPAAATQEQKSGDLWVVNPGDPPGAHRVGPNPSNPGRRLSFSSDTRLSGGGAWDAGQADGGPYGVQRTDLRDGSVRDWYTAPANTSVFILAFDGQSHPILALFGENESSTRALMILTGPNQTSQIAIPSGPPVRFATAYQDPHGIWLGSPGSLWMYRSGSLIKVADVPLGLVGAPTPMPIANARQSTASLPPVVVDGDCA